MEDPMTESELKRAFSIFDINNDGTIEVGEMSLAMREMGIDATFAEIKVLFKKEKSLETFKLLEACRGKFQHASII